MQPVSQSLTDYEPLKGAGRERADADEWPEGTAGGAVQNDERADEDSTHEAERGTLGDDRRAASKKGRATKKDTASKKSAPSFDASPVALKRGHSATYIGLFLFTLLLYLRPSELYPSFVTNNIAFVVGLLTLAVYLPTQLSIEGTLSARPREVNAVLLLCVAALLSIPLAASPPLAWETFSGVFIRCVVIFIVLVNAVRTERRLRWLLLLAVLVSCWLSVDAINDYRLGNLTVEGYRVGGRGTGIFGNSNDLALHLVTIAPIAVSLLFASRGFARKLFYGSAALLMAGAVVVTYSRGGFLGLLCAFAVLAWKLGRRHRVAVFGSALSLAVGMLVFAPGNYAARLLSIFVPSLDPTGSFGTRREELIHSFWTAVFNPIFGVGMGNYLLMSRYEHVTHNAYTEVAAELGLFGLICYLVFVFTPIKRMRRVERETLERNDERHYYYLAVGLQASLVGYLVSSFFASVAFLWYVYYLVGYAICLERIYESERAAREATSESRGDAEGHERETAASMNEPAEA
jgi:O-antigen ligase